MSRESFKPNIQNVRIALAKGQIIVDIANYLIFIWIIYRAIIINLPMKIIPFTYQFIKGFNGCLCLVLGQT